MERLACVDAVLRARSIVPVLAWILCTSRVSILVAFLVVARVVDRLAHVAFNPVCVHIRVHQGELGAALATKLGHQRVTVEETVFKSSA